jgi:uncharacterized protein (TIGR00730 family)
MGNRRRRYALGDEELDARIAALATEVSLAAGREADADYARQLMVSALRLLREDRSTGELKLLNAALKELRHALRVFAPYEHVRKVSVFGSARTDETAPEWRQAHDFAARMGEAGWMAITGAGHGIMGAAQSGAGRDHSFGVNIQLPFEQQANPVIAGDPKLINFRYFFTRKVMFVKESHAVALFPGGFGTHDEGFEALTLIQTGKCQLMPVVFVDAPGASYWQEWREWVDAHLRRRGLISEDDMALFLVTDDVEAAVREILRFYANYHSSRFVGDDLVIRLLRAPDPDELEALQDGFSDLLVSGRMRVSEALPQEGGELVDLPRLVLRFDRRRVGRLRALVDRLNERADIVALEPPGAIPIEVVAGALSPEQEDAEAEDAQQEALPAPDGIGVVSKRS